MFLMALKYYLGYFVDCIFGESFPQFPQFDVVFIAHSQEFETILDKASNTIKEEKVISLSCTSEHINLIEILLSNRECILVLKGLSRRLQQCPRQRLPLKNQLPKPRPELPRGNIDTIEDDVVLRSFRATTTTSTTTTTQTPSTTVEAMTRASRSKVPPPPPSVDEVSTPIGNFYYVWMRSVPKIESLSLLKDFQTYVKLICNCKIPIPFCFFVRPFYFEQIVIQVRDIISEGFSRLFGSQEEEVIL